MGRSWRLAGIVVRITFWKICAFWEGWLWTGREVGEEIADGHQVIRICIVSR